ncbi:MAG: AsmA family protein [Candidatus Acidiferrales bacterium]
MKKVLIVVGIIVAVLIVAVIAIPFFVDANAFKPTLESDLSTSLGRKVEIGNISLKIWSGSIAVDKVAIADDPAFSQKAFLTAQQLKAGVALMPLIFSKKLEMLSLTIDAPQVSLIRSKSGTWNFSSLGGKNAKEEPTGSSSANAEGISVQKFSITNGKMTVAEPNGKGRTYDNVSLVAENISYTSKFPFQFSANTPGQGAIKLTGEMGPVNSTNAAMTPLNAKLDVEHLDLASTGFVDPSSGLGGIVDFNGDLDSDGKMIDSHGSVRGQSLKLTAGASPSTVPVNVDYETTYNPTNQTGLLRQGNVHVGKAVANLTGSYDASGDQTTVNMKLNGRAMSVPDLEGFLPAVGVRLPSGATLQTGTLDTTLAINGPVDKLVITGPITLSSAKMAGFSLKGALGALSSFGGLGGASGSDTEIQTLHADVRVDPSGQHATNLNVVVPTIGTVTGSGDAAANGDLNCKMVAALSNAGAGGAVNALIGGNGAKGIPFFVKGTTSHPVFQPDMEGMAKSFLGGAANDTGGSTSGAAGAAASALGGLFGKKKKP